MASPRSTDADGQRAHRHDDLGGARGAVRAVVNVFIMFHLAAMFAWCLPIQSILVTNFNERIKPYMLAFSLFQNWSMFAPDPPLENINVDAEITFRDGETRTWKFPRMHELGFVERYYEERYRKYAIDHLRVDSESGLRPDAARYVARLTPRPENPPVTVVLYRSWSEIRPQGQDGSYRTGPWTRVSFFSYTVTPGDLP
jgi:hypothetical protein